MKDKSDNSRGRKKYELTQSYKSYAEYAFLNNENRHPRCENAADSVLCSPSIDEFQFAQLKMCTAEVYCLYFY